MHRRRVSLKPPTVLAVYMAVAIAAGGSAGAVLGALGGVLSTNTRAALATLLALVGAGVALANISGRLLRPLQCDRETPQRWVFDGPVAWPVKNGAALGVGALTRLGFPLWYAVPAGALLTGSAVLGAIVYATYALLRAGGAAVLWAVGRRSGTFDPALDWLPRQFERARLVTTVHLLALAMATAVAVGG